MTSFQSKELVFTLKENSNCRETEETFTASKSWFHRFRCWHELISARLADKVVNENKNEVMKFESKFQGLVTQVVMFSTMKLDMTENKK